MTIVVEIVGIIFMFIMSFIGLWSFIVFNKMYNQMKYRNYILEKMSQNLFQLSSKENLPENVTKIDYEHYNSKKSKEDA